MKFILTGLALGVAWALMQYTRGTITEPAALAGPVVLFGLFGAVLWGVRVLLERYRGGR